MAALKSAMANDDADGLRSNTERLTQASMKIGEHMYKEQQAQPGAPEAADDNVVDAEFEDLDSKKKPG